MAEYDYAYEKAMEALEAALFQLGRSVPRPRKTKTPTGLAYRFEEKSPQQALILKSARMISALKAAKLLLDNGLLLDAGAMMRILDEVGADLMFIAGPTIFGHPPEPRHEQYMREFFQEEFDTDSPLTSAQNRNRVGRRHIRAYVARAYSHGQVDVSQAIAVAETIEALFSGFVHGAGVHTMDLFDGLDFSVQLQPDDQPLADMAGQYSHYIHRATMCLANAAKAIGRDDVSSVLCRISSELFQDDGELRPKEA